MAFLGSISMALRIGGDGLRQLLLVHAGRCRGCCRRRCFRVAMPAQPGKSRQPPLGWSCKARCQTETQPKVGWMLGLGLAQPGFHEGFVIAKQ